MEIKVKTSECCAFFNVSRPTLKVWHARGCPKVGYGRWDLVAVFAWWQDNILQDPACAESMSAAKAKYWGAKANREVLAFERQIGRLLECAEAMKLWSAVVMAAKAKINAMSRKLTPLVLGCENMAEIQEIIQRETDAICNELAEPDLVEVARKKAGDDAKLEGKERRRAPRKARKMEKVKMKKGLSLRKH